MSTAADPLDARRERAARVTLTVALSVPCALLAAQSGITAYCPFFNGLIQGPCVCFVFIFSIVY